MWRKKKCFWAAYLPGGKAQMIMNLQGTMEIIDATDFIHLRFSWDVSRASEFASSLHLRQRPKSLLKSFKYHQQIMKVLDFCIWVGSLKGLSALCLPQNSENEASWPTCTHHVVNKFSQLQKGHEDIGIVGLVGTETPIELCGAYN